MRVTIGHCDAGIVTARPAPVYLVIVSVPLLVVYRYWACTAAGSAKSSSSGSSPGAQRVKNVSQARRKAAENRGSDKVCFVHNATCFQSVMRRGWANPSNIFGLGECPQQPDELADGANR